jgi:putative restriction endonuclease
MISEHDTLVRTIAFDWLRDVVALYGDEIPRPVLAQGFQFRGERVPLVAPQGIFKPQILDLPLSITTSPNSPYDDDYEHDGLLRYRYRGTDPDHVDNRGLREAGVLAVPLVYLRGHTPGIYSAVWPAYVVGDDPLSLSFQVAIDDEVRFGLVSNIQREEDRGRRRYQTTMTQRRLHQAGFRVHVVRAYREQCAICRLRHRELLDAAHIVPDSDPRGDPVVSNGISLCKLHHAAYDRHFIGITPDYEVRVRSDILDESDGPMLQHGLKEVHRSRIVTPRQAAQKPRRELLEERFQRFIRTP